MERVKRVIAVFLLVVFSALLLPESIYHQHNESFDTHQTELIDFTNGVIHSSDADFCFVCHKIIPHFYYFTPFILLSFSIILSILIKSKIETVSYVFLRLKPLRGPPYRIS